MGFRSRSAVVVLGLSSAVCGSSIFVKRNKKENSSYSVKAACLTTTRLAAAESSWDWNWDKRAHLSNSESSESTRSLKHYIFIRHGEYNTDGKSDEEKRLTERGIEQAKMTGMRLSEMNLNITKIVMSTMTRAKETCAIIAKYLPDMPIQTTDLLREGPPIPPDPPHRKNELELKYFAESPRIEAAFRKFVHRPSESTEDEPVEIFVCHANVIRYFLCRVAQFPPQGWLRMSLKHGSITWVTVSSDGDVFIRCIGDSGYMPPSKLTT